MENQFRTVWTLELARFDYHRIVFDGFDGKQCASDRPSRRWRQLWALFRSINSVGSLRWKPTTTWRGASTCPEVAMVGRATRAAMAMH